MGGWCECWLPAVVAGNVTVANALDSGLVEAGGDDAVPSGSFTSRHVLGERLKVPSVAMW